MIDLKIKNEKEILELCRRRHLNKEIDDIIESLMKQFNLSKYDIDDIIKLVNTAKYSTYAGEISEITREMSVINDRYDPDVFTNETLELILEKLTHLYDFMVENRGKING